MSNTCSKCGKCIKENASGCVQESVSDNDDMDKRQQKDSESGLKRGE